MIRRPGNLLSDSLLRGRFNAESGQGPSYECEKPDDAAPGCRYDWELFDVCEHEAIVMPIHPLDEFYLPSLTPGRHLLVRISHFSGARTFSSNPVGATC